MCARHTEGKKKKLINMITALLFRSYPLTKHIHNPPWMWNTHILGRKGLGMRNTFSLLRRHTGQLTCRLKGPGVSLVVGGGLSCCAQQGWRRVELSVSTREHAQMCWQIVPSPSDGRSMGLFSVLCIVQFILH